MCKKNQTGMKLNMKNKKKAYSRNQDKRNYNDSYDLTLMIC